MFGKILDAEDNYVIIENTKRVAEMSLLNLHVLFLEENRSVVGEIIGMSDEKIKILLVGEIRNNIFTSGILKKPTFKNGCRLIYKNEVELLLGSQDVKNKSNLLIGRSNIYDSYYVTAPLNDFFTSHFAIIGNTGSGKTCGVARILQNIFYYNEGSSPINAHLVLFDIYGEYNKAFDNLNNLPGIKFKKYTTKLEFASEEIIKIPPYFLDTDDLALLLDANDPIQIPIIEKSLNMVYILISADEKAIGLKNNVLARSVLGILTSGKMAAQIRDQVVAILSHYNTKDLSLDTPVMQPGFTRTLKQCLNIDSTGNMQGLQAVIEVLEKFQVDEIEKIVKPANFTYTLEDIYYALEFTIITEGLTSSELIMAKANELKNRMQTILNSDNKQFFDYKESIGKENYVKKLFSNFDGDSVQVVNMNFNNVEERFARILTKIFARIFFDFSTKIKNRATFPIHMLLEEAHRYVAVDNDKRILGYNILERITKEGRKYGLFLGFITQRPSELSTTTLSQCSNFLIFRMFFPEDLRIIKEMSSNITDETIEKIKNLGSGTALIFGTAFKVPLFVHLDLPEPMPDSSNAVIDEIWFKQEEK